MSQNSNIVPITFLPPLAGLISVVQSARSKEFTHSYNR